MDTVYIYTIIGLIVAAIIAGVVSAVRQVAKTSDRFVQINPHAFGFFFVSVLIVYNLISDVPIWLFALVFVFTIGCILLPEFMGATQGQIASTGLSQKRTLIERYQSDKLDRLNALRSARTYLAPYEDIWKNLRLSNKYIVLTLKDDEVTIVGQEKISPYRRVRITGAAGYQADNLWNKFCTNFSHNKTYDSIIETCEKYHAPYLELVSDDTAKKLLEQINSQSIKTLEQQENEVVKPKIDINNCSEIEFTELPGVSIVHAKKVIKKREEIGGFSSVDDFFEFIKLKSHMINQLRELVKVEKMRGYVRKYFEGERLVDF